MTSIAIVASGTRGDVQPYIALGRGLKLAGYHVRLLASENFQSLATEAGLEFCSTGESIEAITQSEEWRQVTESGNFLSILAKMQMEMKARASHMAQLLPNLLKGSELILTGMGGIGGVFTIAETLKIPLIQAYVFPFTPSREFPSPLVPNLPFGRLLNKLSFDITRQLFWQTSKLSDVLTREILGIPKGSFWGPYSSLNRRKVPVLYGYSQHVLPRPQDWPEHLHITGYWFLDTANDWAPPSDLVDFLNSGQPPVYIGFGSMGSRDPEKAAEIAIDALVRSGRRGVLASGLGGLKALNLPKSIYMVGSLPHSWLFPQMAALVHHGGAGTTAAGLRAGIPSVIIPFMGDQAFWGKRVVDLGVGPRPIPRKQLSSQRLAETIQEALSNDAIHKQAKDLGEKIRAENGIANAISLIHAYLQQYD